MMIQPHCCRYVVQREIPYLPSSHEQIVPLRCLHSLRFSMDWLPGQNISMAPKCILSLTSDVKWKNIVAATWIFSEEDVPASERY